MYLVSDGAGNTLLIDPACSSLYEQQMLYRSVNEVVCQQRGLSAESGLTILATHGHLDHLWGAAWACEQWHTPVLMHEADIPMAKAMQAQYDLFGIGGTPVPFPLEPLPVNQSVSPSIHHSAAEPRLIPSLKILSTPGHTPGSVCFYFPEDGVLFSGDTLFQMGYGHSGTRSISFSPCRRRPSFIPVTVPPPPSPPNAAAGKSVTAFTPYLLLVLSPF